jgi:hypothetical protein
VATSYEEELPEDWEAEETVTGREETAKSQEETTIGASAELAKARSTTLRPRMTLRSTSRAVFGRPW